MLKHVQKVFTHLSLVGALIGLASCGGGGGGGGGPASAFNTAEYRANYGLNQAGALTAYENSGTGTGITVGIIDSGIDSTHADLTGKISALSQDFSGTGLADTNGHGTFIAGIIAGVKNDTGIHGIAYGANVMALKVDLASDATIVAAIDYAVLNGARVLNMSFGRHNNPDGNGLQGRTLSFAASTALRKAYQDALDAGVILVNSSGNGPRQGATCLAPCPNQGIGRAQPEFGARLATCGEATDSGFCGTLQANGKWLSVGSLDADGTTSSSFSDNAGVARNRHLMAAGRLLTSLCSSQRTGADACTGPTRIASGTSFAAPHVAGALAIILQRFPTLTSAQAVDLLLNAATDLGSTGTDTIFGRGRLDLQAAFVARGFSSLPMGLSIGGRSQALNISKIRLGPAFGNALQTNSLLQSAILLDGYGRPFHTDLRKAVSNGTVDPGVKGFIGSSSGKIRNMPLGDVGTLTLSISPTDKSRSDQSNFSTNSSDQEREEISSAFYNVGLSDSADMFLAFNSSPLQLFSQVANVAGGDSPFYGLEFVAAPQLTLIAKGSGAGTTYFMGEGTRLDFGYIKSEEDVAASRAEKDLVQATLSHAFKSGPILKLGIGRANEDDSLFNSSARGAFGGFEDSTTSFVNFSAAVPVTSKLTAHFNYSESNSKLEYNEDGYLSNWSSIRANSFSLGVTAQDMWQSGDNIGFAVYQPMRVRRAKADLRVAVGTDPVPNGAIHYSSDRVSLAPTGRELDLQLAYKWKPLKSLNASTYSVLMINPGHVPSNRVDMGAGVKVWLNF